VAARPWNPCLKKTIRLTLTCLGLAACLYGLSRLAPVFLTPRVIEIDDFPEYWSAGRLNLQGKNPYAADLMEALQRPIGRTPTVMMWNPPVALALAMPFSVLPYQISRIAWLLAQTAAVMVSATWLWDLYGGQRQARWLAWAAAFLFAGTLAGL